MTSTDFMIYSVIAIAGILLQYYILRWTFSVAKRNRHLKAQTELLAKIAEKQGSPKEETENILNEAMSYTLYSDKGKL